MKGERHSLHELSLVQGIIDALQGTAKEKGGRVTSFEVRIGELAQFDIRLVRGLLKDLKAGTPLKDAKFVVKTEVSKVKCASCGSVWRFEEVVGQMQDDAKEAVHFFPELLNTYAHCPSCSSSYLEIQQGRSVRISEVVLDV